MKTESLQLWKRCVAWLIRMDVLAQDKWFGGKKETISAHLGYMQARHGGRIPYRRRPLQAALSRLLDWIDTDHCKNAYLSRQGG
jgi:hypothetical protein